MSVEIAFLIFVAAFMILSSVLKQLAKKTEESDKPESSPPSGWKGKLQQLLRDIQREMEAGREKARTEDTPASARGRWWEEIMQPEEAGEAQGESAGPAEPELEARKRKTGHERDRLAEEKSAFSRAASRTDWTHARAGPEPGEVGMPPAAQAEGPEIRASRISRQSLRQAVIWKEILDKPVALRDQ
ncbi:MAG: hypothetical protein ACOCTS_01865 [Thermodesulfobacteriota bacterium]